MTYRFLAAAICLCLIVAASSPAYSQSDGMIWPIDAAKAISSSFGEPRPGRFHMGIDFKSNGVTGREVYAIGDGTIIRVKTTPFYEGKALYIRLDSGEIAVYMHLSRYTDAIEDQLFRLRIANESYDIDWHPPAGKFRVKKGEIVGWSGDSGSWGAPHLHFELRDANNVPVNPLDHGLDIRDTLPPALDSAVLIPLDRFSSIDGQPEPVWIDFENPPAESLVLSGHIGVALSVWDRVNYTNNLMGVHRASLFVDSTLVFSKTYSRISYDINGCGGLDYLNGGQYGSGKTLSALFRRPGNFIDFYDGAECLNCDDFPAGRRSILKISAMDHPGNTSEGSIPVIFGARPWFSYCGFTAPDTIRVAGLHRSAAIERISIRRRDGDTGWIDVADVPVCAGSCDVRCPVPTDGPAEYQVILTGADSLVSLPAHLACDPGEVAVCDQPELSIDTELIHDRVIVRIESTEPLASIPTVEIICNGTPQTGFHTPVPDGESGWIMAAAFPARGPVTLDITARAKEPCGEYITASAGITFTGVTPGASATVHSPDSLLVMTFPADALYRPAPVRIEPTDVRPVNGLKPVSGGYFVELGDDPPHQPADLRLTLAGEPAERAAIYYSRGNGGWRFLSMEREGRTLRGGYNGTGRVAVFVDDTPPWVAASLPKPGSATADRAPALQIRLEDRGAGIEGSDSIRMAIDGIPVYGEYNTYEGTVTYQIRNPLNPGRHTVTATVIDRAENSTSREWGFRVE